jgi:acyl dehydratase
MDNSETASTTAPPVTNLAPDIGDDLHGANLTVSTWFEVTQAQIDAFSEATGDHQWIHKANAGPDQGLFEGPVAHGLLLVALAVNLARNSGGLPVGTWVLYGFDKLRFRSPVRSGSRIRCRTELRDSQPLGNRRLLNVRLVIEGEGGKIPALTANCSLLCLPADSQV